MKINLKKIWDFEYKETMPPVGISFLLVLLVFGSAGVLDFLQTHFGWSMWKVVKNLFIITMIFVVSSFLMRFLPRKKNRTKTEQKPLIL